MSKIEVFKPCSTQHSESDSDQQGVSIFFVHPKGFDVSPFATLQAIGALTGLNFGEYSLPPASSVLFIDGSRSDLEISRRFEACCCDKDLSKVDILSLLSYNIRNRAGTPGADYIPIINDVIVDELEKLAKEKESLCVIFHDLQSLTEGGTVCKPASFRDLHNRLKVRGAIQLYFVNTESETTQIAVKPDLVFSIAKINDAILPTIKLTLSSSSARLQDIIMPVELEVHFNENDTWNVEESVNRQDQEDAIKALALMGKRRKDIADYLGNMSIATVGRRLKVMEKRGEIIIKGHRVTRV